MPKVYFGRKGEPGFDLRLSDDLIAVRTRSGRSITRSAGPVPSPAAEQLDDATLVVAYPEAGVEVFRVPQGGGAASVETRNAALRSLPDVRFAGGVLTDPKTNEPVLYTENLFVKFVDGANREACREVLRENGLAIKSEPAYAANAFFVEAAEGIGRKVFDVAERLLQRDDVEYCHPELIRPRARKAIFPQQWHLQKTAIGGVTVDAHANVEAAHRLTRGAGVTVAVIDDGIDIDHPEFAGAGKIVAPRDATLLTDDPRPRDLFGTGPDNGDNHGTACAGVAVGNGARGASGVAPAARLMPIRLASGLGSQREADAFLWAAEHGADVISCSWGPADGRWWKPDDPVHAQEVPLPASTKLAIDRVTTTGRGGKGCLVLFAAGNGNEPVGNDGYASYARVIAVAACNDTGKRSVYSDFGEAVWCAFPSNDLEYAPLGQPRPLTTGIWTVDRSGRDGYNTGNNADGDAEGMFTDSFGGTSSACPGAAGVVALLLSVNPALKWNEVRDLLKRASDRIDPQGGDYDAAGHSPKYGYGRLNARTAVELAKPQPRSEVTVNRRFETPIPDLQTVSFALDVCDAAPVEAVSVGVDLKHSYIGDLVITLEPPAATEVAAVILHNRAGGSADAIKTVYDSSSTPGLGGFAGKACAGSWTLRIRDAAAEDAGTLVSFSLRLSFQHPGRAAPPPEAADRPQPARRRREIRERAALVTR